MSQEDLAKAANVDVKTVRDFELGKRWPWSKTRSAIARALQVTTLDLQAAGEPEPSPPHREEQVVARDAFEEAALAADRPYADKLAAIRRHRELIDELGIKPPPALLRHGVRHLSGGHASDGEARGA